MDQWKNLLIGDVDTLYSMKIKILMNYIFDLTGLRIITTQFPSSF